jgi:hypothetical protein
MEKYRISKRILKLEMEGLRHNWMDGMKKEETEMRHWIWKYGRVKFNIIRAVIAQSV